MSYSTACCSIPPIISKGYGEKGAYKNVAGLKTYVTGPPSANKAILFVYDIFGFSPQTLQGADILAMSDRSNPYRVFVPDFFQGKAADISWYPPTTDKHQEALQNFFSSVANPEKSVARIPQTAEAIKNYSANIEHVFALGMCWGGKVVALSSGDATPFKAVAQVHPAMLNPADAKKVTVPMCTLASKDEDPDDVSSFNANLNVQSYVETFEDQIHGWMGTRADLDDPNVREKYKKGYQTVLDFFGRQMSIDTPSQFFLVALWSFTSSTVGSNVIEFIKSIPATATKDGHAYIIDAKAGASQVPLQRRPSRAQGYNVTMFLVFRSAADLEYWSRDDPMHRELVALAQQGQHKSPVVTVFRENDMNVKQPSEVGDDGK